MRALTEMRRNDWGEGVMDAKTVIGRLVVVTRVLATLWIAFVLYLLLFEPLSEVRHDPFAAVRMAMIGVFFLLWTLIGWRRAAVISVGIAALELVVTGIRRLVLPELQDALDPVQPVLTMALGVSLLVGLWIVDPVCKKVAAPDDPAHASSSHLFHSH